MKAKLMGVLNVTPDSFSDGGHFFSLESAISRGVQMAHEGADVLDIGGESTRPGSAPVSLDEELERVIPVIEALKQKTRLKLSIDTMKAEVADAAVKAGAEMINDVSGFRDEKMVEVALRHGVEICCVHMLGTPKTMQDSPFYQEGVIAHLLSWMKERVDYLTGAGIKKEKIILDPGIGFGKTVAHNLEIIQTLHKLRRIGYPLLVGASRKSFMTKILGKPPMELGAATLAVHVIAVLKGADYLRVHDIAEHRDALEMLQLLEFN